LTFFHISNTAKKQLDFSSKVSVVCFPDSVNHAQKRGNEFWIVKYDHFHSYLRIQIKLTIINAAAATAMTHFTGSTVATSKPAPKHTAGLIIRLRHFIVITLYHHTRFFRFGA
jgi:hypothetical protein